MELALVMPVMLGMIMVLFQFGILFISYLGLIHMGRDVERWLAVHPDSTDTTVMLYITRDMPNTVMFPTSADGPGLHCTFSSGTQAWACAPGPTLSQPNPGGLLVVLTPTCGSSAPCAARTTGSMQTVTLAYDASSRMFLPTTFRLGWLNVPMPGAIQTYQLSMMVEPH